MSKEDQLLKHDYDRFNLDKFVEQQEASGGGRSSKHASHVKQPVNSSWIAWRVHLPSRLALTTLACIFSYEVLVAMSMGLKKMRWVMVNWLMYLFLAVNFVLLVALTVVVVINKYDVKVGAAVKLADGSSDAKKEFD
jgi:hypothetical protein